MKLLYLSLTIIISANMLLSSTCDNSIKDNHTKKQYTCLDSIWLQFAKAMDTKDIEFLINNSLDTISCADCTIESDVQKEYFNSKDIFQNHLEKVKHLQSLSSEKFSSYQVDTNLIRVIYNIKTPQAPEGSYGLIFTLIKKERKYLFQGMIVQ